MLTEKNHEKVVDDCMARFNPDASPKELVQNFDELVAALWMRSSRTLSEVTLDAIFERALSISKERFPLLEPLMLEHKERRLQCNTGSFDRRTKTQLLEAFRYLLVMILTLFGNLTADVLLNGLYQELQSFTSDLKEKRA